MSIKYKLLDNGAFVAGDTDSGLTGYACPTSYSATVAKRHPGQIAHEMISGEQWRKGRLVKTDSDILSTDYDFLNWDRLGGRQ